jgi:hypothetical protein
VVRAISNVSAPVNIPARSKLPYEGARSYQRNDRVVGFNQGGKNGNKH